MNHQITLEEMGLIPKVEEVPERSKPSQNAYAFRCGGCICNHCANSVECSERCKGEADFGCFVCDECRHWDGQKGMDNWRDSCDEYKITDARVKRIRKVFKVVKPESEG